MGGWALPPYLYATRNSLYIYNITATGVTCCVTSVKKSLLHLLPKKKFYFYGYHCRLPHFIRPAQLGDAERDVTN